jgi:hypothetical protein
MQSPEFKHRYGGFVDAYQQGSTVQAARTGMAEFNNTMMDLGQMALPSVNAALHDFKSVLEGVRRVLPGGEKPDGAKYGSRALEGALAGGLLGLPFGPGGVLVGATGGGALGAAEAYMEQNRGAKYERPGDRYEERIERLRKEHSSDAGTTAPKATLQPIALSLNINGRELAQAVSTALATLNEYPTGAPAADGMSRHFSGDHNQADN